MTDLDKIKACAKAMNIDVEENEDGNLRYWQDENLRYWQGGVHYAKYNPLENSAQADALEGWLLERGTIEMTGRLFLFYELSDPLSAFEWKADMTVAENRRRARVECVAKMMEVV